MTSMTSMTSSAAGAKIATGFLLALLTCAGILGAPGDAAADDAPPWWKNLYVRVGVLHMAPFENSDEVVLSNIGGPASLAVENGPLAGSGAGIAGTTLAAVTAGYILPWWQGRVSVEAIVLAFPLPVKNKLSAEGTLADEPIAPFALGNIPTGVPALGNELGETKSTPLVATAVYNHFRGKMFQPYAGAGLAYLVPLGCTVSNPILTQVAEPDCEVPIIAFGNLGLVGQIGVELWYRRYFINFDLKYIEKLNVTAKVKNIHLNTPGLPLYETVRVGDASARVGVDPLLVQLGVGAKF